MSAKYTLSNYFQSMKEKQARTSKNKEGVISRAQHKNAPQNSNKEDNKKKKTINNQTSKSRRRAREERDISDSDNEIDEEEDDESLSIVEKDFISEDDDKSIGVYDEDVDFTLDDFEEDEVVSELDLEEEEEETVEITIKNSQERTRLSLQNGVNSEKNNETYMVEEETASTLDDSVHDSISDLENESEIQEVSDESQSANDSIRKSNEHSILDSDSSMEKFVMARKNAKTNNHVSKNYTSHSDSDSDSATSIPVRPRTQSKFPIQMNAFMESKTEHSSVQRRRSIGRCPDAVSDSSSEDLTNLGQELSFADSDNNSLQYIAISSEENVSTGSERLSEKGEKKNNFGGETHENVFPDLTKLRTRTLGEYRSVSPSLTSSDSESISSTSATETISPVQTKIILNPDSNNSRKRKREDSVSQPSLQEFISKSQRKKTTTITNISLDPTRKLLTNTRVIYEKIQRVNNPSLLISYLQENSSNFQSFLKNQQQNYNQYFDELV